MPKSLKTARWIVAMLFPAMTSLAISAQSKRPAVPAPVPMATYSDPATGVSFDYPAVWKRQSTASSYLPSPILRNDLAPTGVVLFSPAGNYYAKTTLDDLLFLYATLPHVSEAACDAQAASYDPGAKIETLTIHGVAMKHFDSSDAGMCHGVDNHVYWTYRAGRCYLFETDMHLSCLGAVAGQRALTASEKRALNRHLLAIPQSIRFALPQ